MITVVSNRSKGVGRAVTSRVTPLSSKNHTKNKPKSVSSFNSPTSSFASSSHLSLLANPWRRHSSSSSLQSSCYFNGGGDVWEWEHVDGKEDVEGFYEDRFVFGTLPVKDEVETALSSLQQILAPASYSQFPEDGISSEKDATTPGQPCLMLRRVPSAESGTDWMDPSMQLYDPNTMQSLGGEIVYDAFHLLRTELSVQRAVVSLSTDKAVWDAVLNNEVIKELRECYAAASETSSTESSVAAKSVLNWIFDNSKAKLMELINRLAQLFAEAFQPPKKKNGETTIAKEGFDGIVSCSVLLSIVVLLIVVLTRAHTAA